MPYHERGFEGKMQQSYMFFCIRCSTHLLIVVEDNGESMHVLGDKASRAIRDAGWTKIDTGWLCPVHSTEGHDEASQT